MLAVSLAGYSPAAKTFSIFRSIFQFSIIFDSTHKNHMHSQPRTPTAPSTKPSNTHMIKWKIWEVFFLLIARITARLLMLNILGALVGVFIAAIAIIFAIVLVNFALIWAAMVFEFFAAFAYFFAHVR